MINKRGGLKNFSKLTNKHKKQSYGGVISKVKMFLKTFQDAQKISLPESLF